MNEQQWNFFLEFRKSLKQKCVDYSKQYGNNLVKLQKLLALQGGSPEYPIENSFVYNSALDDIQSSDNINYIVIGDNPGKDEQLETNQRYLVGHSGKLAENFFKKNKALKTDFRKNVIILNKTPLHTAKTGQIKSLLAMCEKKELTQIFKESQRFFAEWAFKLQQNFDCDLWLVGYSELKKRRIFEEYANCISSLYLKLPKSKQKIYLFQHFSMNRFSIDLKANYNDSLSLQQNLKELGLKHRFSILGF